MTFKNWRARLEVLGLVALAGTAVFFVATSWRKWPDPLIDFGQQLYNAWQLSIGAVLYRDVGCLYGPLSEYFNAGVFRIFGPGLIVLAIANLVIFGAISIIIYILFRRSWGALAAWLSTLVFISVFGFSQFVDAGITITPRLMPMRQPMEC
jgi:4-amino-4-deoxy-L-arabinose transferase-like glycosyltransferase